MLKKEDGQMAKQKKINENYIHNCGSELFNESDYVCCLSDMGFSEEEVINIYKFYVEQALTLRNNENAIFNLRRLSDYGSHGGSDMSRLEGQLLRTANLSNFILIKAETINNTLEVMNLKDRICIEHPRAVMKQNYKVSINEDGSVNLSQSETRMECLFRHIRNSLAHGQTYYFRNDMLMLEDSDGKNITARIVISKQALLDWITIITAR